MSSHLRRGSSRRLSFDDDQSAVISLDYTGGLNSAARPPRQTGALHGGMYAVVADTAGMEALEATLPRETTSVPTLRDDAARRQAAEKQEGHGR